jgi:hypothetical protein
MKKYFLGFLSILLLVASILGAQLKAPKDRRSGRSDCGSGPAMWV